MRTAYDDIVNPFEAGFLESDGFNIVVFFKHGDYIVETDIPLKPIWIPDTWLNASQWQIADLPHRSKNITHIFPYLINARKKMHLNMNRLPFLGQEKWEAVQDTPESPRFTLAYVIEEVR